MKKSKIKVEQKDLRKSGSTQNLMAQRMPARTYVDRKKESAKRACRSKGYC